MGADGGCTISVCGAYFRISRKRSEIFINFKIMLERNFTKIQFNRTPVNVSSNVLIFLPEFKILNYE